MKPEKEILMKDTFMLVPLLWVTVFLAYLLLGEHNKLLLCMACCVICVFMLLHQGLHPRIITEGFDVAKTKALEVLDEIIGSAINHFSRRASKFEILVNVPDEIILILTLFRSKEILI